jgi:hypothetical protein
MLTYSSREVTADSGSPSLLDLGVQLARIPRWCGATKKFFSVLQHQMIVADLLPKKIQIHGLLHDSDECVTEDFPGPLKTDEIRRLQQKIRLRVYKEFGIAPPSDAEHALIKRADVRSAIGEAHTVAPSGYRCLKEFLPRDLAAEKIVLFYASRYSYEDLLEKDGRAVIEFMKRVIAGKG